MNGQGPEHTMPAGTGSSAELWAHQAAAELWHRWPELPPEFSARLQAFAQTVILLASVYLTGCSHGPTGGPSPGNTPPGQTLESKGAGPTGPATGSNEPQPPGSNTPQGTPGPERSGFLETIAFTADDGTTVQCQWVRENILPGELNAVVKSLQAGYRNLTRFSPGITQGPGQFNIPFIFYDDRRMEHTRTAQCTVVERVSHAPTR